MNSDNLALFAAVVHAGSISRAAIEKGLDQSTVNRPCQAIEEAEKLFDHPKKVQGVKLLRGKLEISVRARDAVKVRSPPADWYKLRARKVFARRLDVLLEQALWLKERPPIRILTMQTQWGSCSPNGHITLNPHLVKAPCNCIDYVGFQSGCYQLVLCPSRGSAI